jgi:hypothetical protein
MRTLKSTSVPVFSIEHLIIIRFVQGGELHTAASYLIILQSLEPASTAKQHATQLLDAALDQVYQKYEIYKIPGRIMTVL